jgi:hypothetical protein
MTKLKWRFGLATMGVLAWSALAQEPQVVTRLEAWADVDQLVHVRWITDVPTKARVEYQAVDGAVEVLDEDADVLRGTTNNRDAGTGWASNHRADFAGISVWPGNVRVVGQTRDGKAFQSQSVVVSAAKPPVGRAVRATIAVAVSPGDWKLERLPLTFGVPFPQGELAYPANLRLLGPDGAEVPCQVKLVGRWRADLSVRWLRLDALVPAAAKTLTIEYGSAVTRRAVAPAVVLPATTLPAVVAVLTAADGKAYRGTIEETVTEESGLVKTVLRARGHYVAADGAQLGAFTVRASGWSSPGIQRLEYTFENDRTAEELTTLRSLVLAPVRAGGPDPVRVATEAGEITLTKGGSVLQREDFEWVQQPSGVKGKRLPGVVWPGAGQAAVVMRNCWQLWPVSIAADNGAVEFGLCPELPKDFYAGRKDEEKLYYQIRDGLHTFRQGFSRTWEFWLVEADAAGAASLTGERPVASLPPEWLENSGVFQKLAISVRDSFRDYDEAVARGIDRYLDSRDASREYGMMNFGDWFGERRLNWGNLEYDLGHGFLTQFMRTGNPAFCRRAEECVRHERDVDTRHYAKDPRQVGQQWTHSMGHTAGYYPKGYQGMEVYSSPGWSDNRGHIWAQGMIEHYLLGGDTRSWETGTLIADWAAGPQTTNFTFGNARETGWMTKLVMSAYLATDDPFYLNAAKIMLDGEHAKSVASGDHGFYFHELQSGHCDCPKGQKHSGEANFMLGVLMTGMTLYYHATGDERVAADIVKIARFCVETMWVPEQLAFRYTSCPKTNPSASSAWIMMQGLAFAAHHANDAALADVCRKALAAAWSSLPSGGKSAGYVLCSSAQALEEISQLEGVSFAEYRVRIDRMLRNPGRRWLPTNVPNPDFELAADGWPSRGVATERVTSEKHSGAASLHISGKMTGQGEYVNTRYETQGDPAEIVWLKPKQTYRLAAWLRVDRVSPTTPAPSLRLAFRDASGSRTAAETGKYDLAKLGTWQRLLAEFEVPEWNTRNYIALNTNTRAEVEIDMFLDDVSLAPLAATGGDPYTYLRLDLAAATLSGGATIRTDKDVIEVVRLTGPGKAAWSASVEAPGRYWLWAVLEPGARLAGVRVNGQALPAAEPPAEATWVRLGVVDLKAGAVAVELPNLSAAPTVQRLVLTNDPGSSL